MWIKNLAIPRTNLKCPITLTDIGALMGSVHVTFEQPVIIIFKYVFDKTKQTQFSRFDISTPRKVLPYEHGLMIRNLMGS